MSVQPHTLPRFIGIAGKAGAGKDSAAEYLRKHYGYGVLSLAAPIKQLLNERFGWCMQNWEGRVWKESPVLFTDDGGDHWSPRELAQWLGTEVGRVIGGENVWLQHLQTRAVEQGYDRVVVPDIRFENEAKWILNQGGIVIHVWRSDAPPAPVASHVSENSIPELYIDYAVENEGPGFSRLYANLDRVLEEESRLYRTRACLSISSESV